MYRPLRTSPRARWGDRLEAVRHFPGVCKRSLVGTLLLLSIGCARASQAEEPVFRISEIPVSHRVVQADLIDLDGDGLGDLLWTAVQGVPPLERRELRVHFQREDGSLPEHPDWQQAMPDGAAAYDLGDVDSRAGQELLLLRRDDLMLLSLAGREADFRSLPLPASPTLAVSVDERGIDRLRLIHRDLDGEGLLVVPGFGESMILGVDGSLRGRPRVGGRSNYFIPERPGPVVSESDVEIYYDHPRVTAGDVDGDGHVDLLASSRHDLRVFLQGEDGRFPANADQTLALGRLSAEDHIRNVGSVRIEIGHINGDAGIDLLILNSSGSFFDSESELDIYLNQGGSWNLEEPDQRIDLGEGLSMVTLRDLDGDGEMELISAEVPGGILEIVELLVTANIDASISIRRQGEKVPFEPSPWKTRDIEIGFSFETFRTRGFVPQIAADMNGDRQLDFINSGDGDEIEIHLGSRERGFGQRHAAQSLDTLGRIRFGELQGDDLADFVIYDPRRPRSPIRIGWNLGTLAPSSGNEKKRDTPRHFGPGFRLKQEKR